MSKWKITTLNVGCLTKRLSTNWRNLVSKLFTLSCCNKHTIVSSTKAKPTPRKLSMNQQRKRISCTVVETYSLSPIVRGLKLKVHSKDFSFQAGQWVDFFVPNIESVAGYSICSSPKFFRDTSLIELAIKNSPYAPTKWVHEECQVGSKIAVSLGGDFIYSTNQAKHKKYLLLIAGGVGINPLVSILRHVVDVNDKASPLNRVVLLHSVQKIDDLIFKDDICKLMTQNKNISVEYFITRHDGTTLTQYLSPAFVTTNHKIDKAILSSRLQLNFTCPSDWECYLCGPSPMIDEVNIFLQEIGLKPEQIRFEKWW